MSSSLLQVFTGKAPKLKLHFEALRVALLNLSAGFYHFSIIVSTKALYNILTGKAEVDYATWPINSS